MLLNKTPHVVTIEHENHLVIQLSYWLIHITWCQTGHGLPLRELTFRFEACVAWRFCREYYWAAKCARTSVLLCALSPQNCHATQAILFVDGSRDSMCYVLLQAGYLDSLSSSEFVRLTRMVEDFVMDCERICGRQSHSLRATLLTQAKKFVERFHEERRNKLR